MWDVCSRELLYKDVVLLLLSLLAFVLNCQSPHPINVRVCNGLSVASLVLKVLMMQEYYEATAWSDECRFARSVCVFFSDLTRVHYEAQREIMSLFKMDSTWLLSCSVAVH